MYGVFCSGADCRFDLLRGLERAKSYLTKAFVNLLGVSAEGLFCKSVFCNRVFCNSLSGPVSRPTVPRSIVGRLYDTVDD